MVSAHREREHVVLFILTLFKEDSTFSDQEDQIISSSWDI